VIYAMRLLYLTLADIDDHSYGGAIRSHPIREAMLQVGEVATLVSHGAFLPMVDSEWQPGRIKRALYAPGARLGQLRQRLAIRRWVAATVEEGRYDAIVARYVGLALFVPFGAWSRLVIDADDIVKSTPRDVPTPLRVRARLWLRNLAARVVLTRAAHVWYVNPAEGSRLKARAASWVPNVVQMPDDHRVRPAPVPGRILMVGYFNHPPNAQGLQWFAAEVLPALRTAFPQAELHVAGKYPAALAEALGDGAIRLLGFVDSLAEVYDRAALVIAPIHFGGGTQIKVIDALAHGRPLVATRFAHSGFAGELSGGEHLLLADDATEWIAQCTSLLSDPAAAEAMAARGREAVAGGGAQRVTETVRTTLLGMAGTASLPGPLQGSERAARR
jgi:glycosyltransferase involved in cell wall biosynthesis